MSGHAVVVPSPVTDDAVDLGFDPHRLERLTALLDGYVEGGRLPFVMCQVARDGRVAYRHAHGWADVDERRPIADTDVVRIFSMTKPIVSAALMMLYETGEVLLENPVSRFIPELGDLRVWADGDEDRFDTVESERPVLVGDLLTHTAGFTAGHQLGHPLSAHYRRLGLDDITSVPTHDLAEEMERLGTMPLLHQPGAAFSYSIATDVVARIIEVVSGQRLDDFLAERVFGPLGMVDTGFHAREASRLTSLYARTPRTRLRRVGPAGPETVHTTPPTLLSGTGGLVSTLDDYQRFVDMVLGGGAAHGARLLGPATVAAMTRNQLPGGRLLNEMEQKGWSESVMGGTGFGWGFEVMVDPGQALSVASTGEASWGGAASTSFWVDRQEGITVVFLTQLMPSSTYPIRRQLRAVVQQAVMERRAS